LPGLRDLVWRALALRIGLAILLHFSVSESTFAPDQETYHFAGNALAGYWTGERFTPPAILSSSPKGYIYLVGVLYWLFGSWALVPKILNGCVGALTVPLVHDLALRITGQEAVAVRSARFTAYFPSLVLWSALNLRDIWIVFLILLICKQAIQLQESFRLRNLALLVFSILIVMQFRDYIFFAIAAPMIVSFFVRGRANVARNATIGMLLALVVIAIDASGGVARKMRIPDLETLTQYRQYTGFGGSKVEANADVSTPGRALAFLPIGVAYFLLAPFPWQLTNLRQLLTLPEMLFLYFLMAPMVRGILHLLRHRLAHSLMVIMTTVGLTVGYALGQANVGTAYRYRAQVLPFYLIFAAAGLELRRRATPETASRAVPAT
jgi:hypothetical protein